MEPSTIADGRQVKVHALPHGSIYEASAQDVYPLLKTGSYEMAWVDGPYGLNKAGWDCLKTEDLPEWYEPHIRAWGSLLSPSASIYHWGTAASWAAVHPVYLRLGWTFRTLITWYKSNHPAIIGWKTAKGWLDITEVAGVYYRDEPPFNPALDIGNVWKHSLKALSLQQIKQTQKQAAKCKTDGMTFQSLHPCQKPDVFTNRAIMASTRPGGAILEPFGGTCRVAVSCEQIARYNPKDARRYTCIELNQDGVDYVRPVIRQIEEEGKQVSLFEARSP